MLEQCTWLYQQRILPALRTVVWAPPRVGAQQQPDPLAPS